MKSPLIIKIECILNKKIGYYYDCRHGKQIKYRVKIRFTSATDEQLEEIRKLPHVVKANNFQSTRYSGKSIAVFLDKKLSEIRVNNRRK